MESASSRFALLNGLSSLSRVLVRYVRLLPRAAPSSAASSSCCAVSFGLVVRFVVRYVLRYVLSSCFESARAFAYPKP